MNSHTGNAQDSKPVASAEPNVYVLLNGDQVQSSYLQQNVNQVNRSNLTLQKPDSSQNGSRQSHPRIDFDLRTRVEVGNQVMHDTSSFNNTMIGDHTPNYYLQHVRDKSNSPLKSPSRIQQAPQIDRVPLKQREFVMRPGEQISSPRKSNLSEIESQNLIKKRRSPLPTKKKNSPKAQPKPSDLSIIVRSNSQQEILVDSQNLAYEGIQSQQAPQTSGNQTLDMQSFEVQSKGEAPVLGTSADPNSHEKRQYKDVDLTGSPAKPVSHLSEVHFGHESSDQDKLQSRHYQDYLLSNEDSRKDLREHHSGSKARSNSINYSNRKQSHMSSKINNRILEHDFTIEEIKEKHLQRVTKALDPFFKEKGTLDTVLNTEQQMKRRLLPHTYESFKKQMRSISPSVLKKQAGGVAVRNILPPSENAEPELERKLNEDIKQRLKNSKVGRIVFPITQVQVPKDLILMKIAQKQVSLHREHFTSSMLRSVDDSRQLTSTTTKNERQTPNKRQLSLPPLNSPFVAPGAQTSRVFHNDVALNQNSLMENSQDQNNQKHKAFANLLKQNNRSVDLDDTLYQESTDVTSAGPSIGFHITDLLQQSNSRSGVENMKAAIEYYKRSIKSQNEMQMQKEVVIKNYRLRVIDAAKDLTDFDRKLMKQNKGTSIFVANSLIRPEIYRFSTRVSNAIVEVFAEMKDGQFSEQQSKQILSSNNFDSLTFQDQLENETRLQEEQSLKDLILDQSKEGRGPQFELQPELHDPIRKLSSKLNINPRRGETSPRQDQNKVQTPFAQPPSTGLRQQITSAANSRGVSSGIYYEQEELQAVMQSEYNVLQWLHLQVVQNNEQAQQVDENQNDGRYVLTNGELAPLTKKEITARMGAKRQAGVQPNNQSMPPLEDLTAQTQFKDRPYMHLMRSVVVPEIRRHIHNFINETIKFKDASLKNNDPMNQLVNYEMALKAIKFVRDELNHLDPHLLHDVHLNNELFVEKKYTDELINRMNALKADEKLKGKTDFVFIVEGKQVIKSIDIEVTAYNYQTSQFLVKNEALGLQTVRSRNQIQLDTDHPDFKKQIRTEIIKFKSETQQYLRVLRLISNELLPRFSNHALPQLMRQNILKYCKMDLTSYEQHLVEKVIGQVESLYVFSLMKATISSQKDDPYIKNMMINFKISYDSPAIYIEPQPSKEKRDLHPGIYAFKREAIKNELQDSSISMSSKKYMILPRLLYEITYKAIEDKLMFQAPIPVPLLFNYGGAAFVAQTMKQIDKRYNTYPLTHTDWIQAQKVISEQFNVVIRAQWSEVIANQVWSYIKDDFDFETEKHFYEHQIDENLLRLLKQIKSYQTNILYAVFEKGIRSYLRFLIGFAIRDPEIRKSKIVITIRKSDKFRLVSEDPNYVPAVGEDYNDVDLIPLQLRPMANLRAEIEVTGKTRNRKYKVITVPEIDEIQKGYFSVVKNLLDSTRNLKRVDRMIFPYLSLDDDYIPQPDVKTNPKMTYILKLVDKLLEQCMMGSQKQVVSLASYLSIFEKKVDGIILELKKKTFDLQNEGSDNEQSEIKLEAIKEEDQKAGEQQTQQKPESAKKSSTAHGQDDDESDADDAGGQGGNNLAYKSVEIDQLLLRDELFAIRKHRNSIMDEVQNSYDYGLLLLDCTPFSQFVLSHCAALEREIVNYLQSEFTEKMRSVNFEIGNLSGRLKEKVTSIDDVVALLDYIDSIKKQDNKIEEIADFIEIMTRQMTYIDSLRVILPEQMKIDFLHMRNWPRTFDTWVKKRKGELLVQKACLIVAMNTQTEEVFAEVEEFKIQIQEIMRRGLRKVNVEERNDRQELIRKVFDSLIPKDDQLIVPAEIPPLMTFQWLSQEAGWLKQKFDSPTIQDVSEQIVEMKSKFDEIDKTTVVINKRQALLGVQKTEFKALKEVQDDLKPLFELWTVANLYRQKVPVWLEGPIDKVDALQLEQQIDDWLIEMKRLQKSNLTQTKLKQAELLQYIFETLSYLKKYMPMIKATRTKGMTVRHWRQINSALKITIDPSSSCFLHLIGMRLHEEEAMKTIKAISDLAQKEYAVQVSMEQLERDVMTTQFQFENGPSQSSKLCKDLDNLVYNFEEFMVRVQLLKMNPYIKSFFDKLLEIEKILKYSIEILIELECLQSSWLYLQSIFSQNILSDSLAFEIGLWQNIDAFFKGNIRSFIEQPLVWKIVQREGFITQLRKSRQETEQCRDGLNRFLEMKRQMFPRLYFLSNEALLYIYGNHKDVIEMIKEGTQRTFVSTLFQGVEKLVISGQRNQVTDLISRQGEKLELWLAIPTENSSVEIWLKKMEDSMHKALKHHIIMTYCDMDKDMPQVPEDHKELKKYKLSKKFQSRQVDSQTLKTWASKWPSQCTYLSLQIWFTQKMQQVFDGAQLRFKQVGEQRRLLARIKQIEHSDASSTDEYESVGSQIDENELQEHILENSSKDQLAQADSNQISVQQMDFADNINSQEEDNNGDEPEIINSTDYDPDGNDAEGNLDDTDMPKKKGPTKQQSRLSIADRIIRKFDRFQLNEIQHPDVVLQDVKSSVMQKIQILLQCLQEKIEPKVRKNFVSLITACVYQRDQLQLMMDKRVFKPSDFEWEITFKFEIEEFAKVFRQISAAQVARGPSEWETRLELNEFILRVDVFNFQKLYGYEYLGNCDRLVITPLTLKAQRSMLVALQFQFGGAVEGPFGTGKTETAKDLSRTLARPCQVFNASEKFNLEEVTRLFKGVAGSGCWVLIDEFNRMSQSMMNSISVLITQIQNALRQQLRFVNFGDLKLTLNEETSIFISLNPGYAGRTTLLINMKNLFRPISMVVPDSALICEIMLASSGFFFAESLSKKFVHIQHLADVRMKKASHFKHDFGLRAIKAVIERAESLLRQVQYLTYCELPDLICESTMSRIHWKDNQLIGDVIQELNRMGQPLATDLTSKKSPFATPMPILVNVNSGSSGAFVLPGVESQTSQVQLSDVEDTESSRFQGEFFDVAFNVGRSRKERQMETLYAIIGVKTTKPTEEELEEQIIIKALKDFNKSKFADEEHAIIMNIIYDVFPSAIPVPVANTVNNSQSIDVKTQSNYSELKELTLQYFSKEKLDHNPVLESKVYQLYEITQVKVGCIILGEAQSAKSTLIQTLAGALNMASQNELKLLVTQERKKRLKQNVIESPMAPALLSPEAVKYWKQQFKTKTAPASNLSGLAASIQKIGLHRLGTTIKSNSSNTPANGTEQAGLGGVQANKKKLSEKQKMVFWYDLYNKTKLDRIEIFGLEQQLVMKGVKTARINPKAMSKNELIGQIDDETQVWQEGLFTQVLRRFSKDETQLKKWIHLDGPMDYDWVENLNSILDDNRKIDLPNGDTICLSDNTCLLFETDSLSNVTPATISRCGLVYMDKQSTCNPKAIFNQYLSRLSPNLTEYQKDIEAQANWLIPTCFEILKEERQRGTLLVPQIDENTLMQSFIKLLDSFLTSYWIDHIKGNVSDFEDAPQQAALRKCLEAYGRRKSPVDITLALQEGTVKLDPDVLQNEFNVTRLPSAGTDNVNSEERIAVNDFLSNENRVENSLKFLVMWLEAFLITSLTGTFGPIFSTEAKNRLAEKLKIRMEDRRSDFQTYQKNKKKQQQQLEEQKKASAKALSKQLASSLSQIVNNVQSVQLTANPSASSLIQTPLDGKLTLGANETQQIQFGKASKSLSSYKFAQEGFTIDGFTTEFVAPIEDSMKPLFITEFPFENDFNLGLFDFYFSLENNQWTKFDTSLYESRMYLKYQESPSALKQVENVSVTTIQQVKMYYALECLLTMQRPILVCGQGASGKSTFVKDFVFHQVNVFTRKLLSDHMTCTNYTTAVTFKENFERNLETMKTDQQLEQLGDSDTEVPIKSETDPLRPDTAISGMQEVMQSLMEWDQETVLMRPSGDDIKILYYIEDMHLTEFDKFQDNCSGETLRELIQYHQWFSTKRQNMRSVEDVNFIGCYNTKSAQRKLLSQRLLRHFSVFGLEMPNETTTFTVVNRLLELHSMAWNSSMQEHVPKLSRAIIDIYKRCHDHLKPSPIKVQYTFNQRQIFKLLSAVCTVEVNYVSSIDKICKLFYHECTRQFGDRILMKHDLKWFQDTLKNVCAKNLYDLPEKSPEVKRVTNQSEDSYGEEDVWFENFPVKDIEDFWFSTVNEEVEGYYQEVRAVQSVRILVETWIDRYNEQKDKRKLSFVLYDELVRHLLKILRAISINGGHLILVGLKGYAVSWLVKLATFINSKNTFFLEMHSEYGKTEWLGDLRTKLIAAAQNDQPQCFVIDEYRITNNLWFQDIERIMTCNQFTHVLSKQDFTGLISAIKVQNRRSDREQVSEIQANLAIDGVAEANSNVKKVDTNKINAATIILENSKLVLENPLEANEAHAILQMRIKKNIQFIIQFSPTGQNFRDKLQRNPELILNSQLVWIQNLATESLMEIAKKLFLEVVELDQQTSQLQDTTRDARFDELRLVQERENHLRVAKSFIQIYQQTIKFAKVYQQEHKQTLYFTPKFLMRLITAYRRLLKEREKNVLAIQGRYKAGLDKISETIKEITNYYKQLESKTPVLQAQQKKLVAIIVDIEEEYERITQQREFEKEEEFRAQLETNDAKQLFDSCQNALDRIAPCLNDAINSMQQLSKYQLAEIRSLQHPPKMVKMVLKAVCVLLDVEPQMKRKQNGENKLSYWRAAISPLVLADPNLPIRLEQFDRNKLTEEKMGRVEEIISEGEYTLENAKKSCFAVEGLYMWVKAIRDYFYIFRELEPRRDALILAEKQYNVKLEAENSKKSIIKDLEQRIQQLRVHQLDKTKLVEELKLEIQDQMVRKRRADALLRGLSSEKQKWIVCSRMLDSKYQTVSGDVVLAAAIVTFGGAFTFTYRKQLVEKWQQAALQANGLECTENFLIQELFGDNFQAREWHANGLQGDKVSTDNALIMQKSKQYCLCIDPQQQALGWLKTQYGSQGAIVTRMNDANFKKSLEVAIDIGKVVLVENLPERVDVNIESLVKQEITKYQDLRMIKFCRKQLKIDKGFKLILVTSIPKPSYDVNLTNHVTIVNFFVSLEGLSQNILHMIVANERPDLEDGFNDSMEVTFTNIKILKEVENDVLQCLEGQDVHLILSNEFLIDKLRESREIAELIASRLRKINQVGTYLEKARVQYTSVAFRAATLYFAIQDLHSINPMYKFSLHWYLTQFKQTLKLANQLNKKQNENKNVKIGQEEFILMDTKLSVEERSELLKSSLTQEIIRKITFSVFQEDRQIMTYFLALRILQAEQIAEDELLSFAIMGSKVVSDPSPQWKANNNIKWLNENMWSELQYLSQLRPFSKENLLDHLLKNQEEWAKLAETNLITFEDLPNSSNLNLDQFNVVDLRDAMGRQDKRIHTSSITLVKRISASLNLKVSKEKARKSRQQLEKMTEEEALADESIWMVSESEAEDDSSYNRKDRNPDFHSSPSLLAEEEKQMARYMVERAPGSVRDTQDFSALQSMTKRERKTHALRQQVVKNCIELAVLKCIRPDLINTCLHSLVSTVYDFEYATFDSNVLSRFIDPDGTLDMRRQKSKYNADALNQISFQMPQKQQIENNIQLLINEAYSESTCMIPVLFLISHSVNVFQELQVFCAKQGNTQRLSNIQCKAEETAKLHDQLKRAMLNGEWVLIEGLQMEPSWMAIIEQYITQFTPETNHNKFRLWLTVAQMDDFSDFILKSTIKIALQQPINIKKKIERHFQNLKDGVFRKSIESGNLHKNVYFGLSYLHAILDGRRLYGTIGWNVPHEFDANDFDISENLLASFVKRGIKDQQQVLKSLKYIFSKINFAGKVCRVEDLRKMQAHIEDLFNEEISLSSETPLDLDHSHYGMPAKEADFMYFINMQIPQQDSHQIFGLNQNLDRQQKRNQNQTVLLALKNLTRQAAVGYDASYGNIQTDIDNQLKKFALERYGTTMVRHSNNSGDLLVKSFISLQNLLKGSSLDSQIVQDQDRYDERIDEMTLPQRDQSDKLVLETAKHIIRLFNSLLLIPENWNTSQEMNPIRQVILRELKAYQNIRNTVVASVKELTMYLEGDVPMPLQTEKLWQKVQNNVIPPTWLQNGYPTAITSLAHFVFEFTKKAQYWQNLIQSMTENELMTPRFYDISNFFDVGQLVYSILQQGARLNGVQTRQMRNNLTITSYFDPSEVEDDPQFLKKLEENPQMTVLYGLWIEGAEWDVKQQILIEPRHSMTQQKFPAIEVDPIVDLQNSTPLHQSFEETFELADNPPLTKQQKTELKRAERQKLELQNAVRGVQTINKNMKPSAKGKPDLALEKAQKKTTEAAEKAVISNVFSHVRRKVTHYYYYKCPVFETTNRLSLGGIGQENKPLFYVDLRTLEKPRKWVKRSVALLLEPNVLY